MPLNKSQIEEDIKEIMLKIVDVDPEDLKPQADFYKDLGADSIKAIEIVVALEKHFKISIREEEMASISTLEKVTELITKSLSNTQKQS